MMIMPGRRLLKADPPPPRLGCDAADAGSTPVEPLAKPIFASLPLFESTTAFFQSGKPVPIADHPYDVAQCDLCVRECPVANAISIETFTTPDGKTRRQPVVHEPCVGCGVCEMVCPVEPSCITIEARAVWKA